MLVVTIVSKQTSDTRLYSIDGFKEHKCILATLDTFIEHVVAALFSNLRFGSDNSM